jgi:hypothetical protein
VLSRIIFEKPDGAAYRRVKTNITGRLKGSGTDIGNNNLGDQDTARLAVNRKEPGFTKVAVLLEFSVPSLGHN